MRAAHKFSRLYLQDYTFINYFQSIYSMSLASVEISPPAYAKILSHTIKYQHYTVNGLLVGSQVGNTLLVQDVYPLFHTGHGLTPMLEIALIQLDTTLPNTQSIVGYYQAFENCTQQTPDVHCDRIMEKLSEHFKLATMLLVDNHGLAKIQENGSSIPFHVFNRQDNSLRLASKVRLSSNQNLVTSQEVIEKMLHEVCVDFDDHLEEVALDWSNRKITEVIDAKFSSA